MVRRKCKHCPIPGCSSKFLIRLADHLTRIHDLSELERKYWLQFAKLQNTSAICVYNKGAEPKPFLYKSKNVRVHMNVVPRGTMNTNGEKEN